MSINGAVDLQGGDPLIGLGESEVINGLSPR